MKNNTKLLLVTILNDGTKVFVDNKCIKHYIKSK